MGNERTFGSYLKELRLSRGVRMADIADLLGVSLVYISDIERDRKAAPIDEHLRSIAEYLELDEDESALFYDLAAVSSDKRKGISPDLPDYIMDKEVVRAALRTAKKYDIDDEEWLKFIKKIESAAKKKGRKDGG